MKKIKEFTNEKGFINYVTSKIKTEIGEGSEGKVYLTNDGEVIKIMIDAFEPKEYNAYSDIIMDSDIKLDSFIFPKELYIINGIIVGYKEDVFRQNIFNSDLSSNILDVEQLIRARQKFIEDTKVITENKYSLFELARNILFDNKKLVAIDTLDYIKRDNVTLEENIESLDYALLLQLSDIYPDINCSKPFDNEIEKVLKKYK